MFLEKLRETGTQIINNKITSNNHGGIAQHVVDNTFAVYRDMISNSQPYQDYLSKKSPYFVGPGPSSPNLLLLSNYLMGHSVRKGFKGKLAGIAYKVCESVKEILGRRSDRIAARESVEDLLMQIKKLSANQYKASLDEALVGRNKADTPRAIKVQAESILRQLLAEYNKYVTV